MDSSYYAANNEQERMMAIAGMGLNPYAAQGQPSWQKDFEKLIEVFDEAGGDAILEGLMAAEVVICEGFEQNFYNKVDDQGFPWLPRKDNLPHPLLIKTGRMFRAATDPTSPEHYSDVQGTTLETGIGEAVFYARFHHWGTSRMVARRVIYATPETVNRALEAFADAVEAAM